MASTSVNLPPPNQDSFFVLQRKDESGAMHDLAGLKLSFTHPCDSQHIRVIVQIYPHKSFFSTSADAPASETRNHMKTLLENQMLGLQHKFKSMGLIQDHSTIRPLQSGAHMELCFDYDHSDGAQDLVDPGVIRSFVLETIAEYLPTRKITEAEYKTIIQNPDTAKSYVAEMVLSSLENAIRNQGATR